MDDKHLVVMIPAFNEEKTIGNVIKSIPKNISGIKKISILVIDDGSTDSTVAVAKKNSATKVVSLKSNLGLGVAFRSGINEALAMKADIVVNIDADEQFDANDIPKIVEPIISGKADMVTCSRFLDKALEPKMPGIKKFGNKIFTDLVNFLTKQKFTDTQCGFRAYSREACLHLNTFGRYTYTQEVFLSLANKNLKIVEVACKVRGEREGKSRVVGNVFSYGIKSLLIIIRTFRDYEPFLFFGSIGAVTIFAGTIILLFIFVRWLLVGQTFPFTSLITAGSVAVVIGFLVLILAMVADMNGRQRRTQEEILYRLKKQEFE